MSLFSIFIAKDSEEINKYVSKEYKGDFVKIEIANYVVALNSTNIKDYHYFKKLADDNFSLNIYSDLNFKPDTFEEQGILLKYDKNSNKFIVDIPLFTPQLLFYSRICDDILVIHNHCYSDFRQSGKVSKAGLFSFLQFATIFPPDTFWADVKRFLPGKTTFINENLVTSEKKNLSANNLEINDSQLKGNNDFNILTKDFNRIFDDFLVRNVPDKSPIISFSGGVDSGYIASRAINLGWKDSILVNYSFGKEDKEAILAKKMAEKLNLELHVIEFDLQKVLESTKKYKDLFPYPYVDISTLPTTQLILEIAEKFSDYKYILDGTGADSIVSNYSKMRKWDLIYSVPLFLRKFGDYLYRMGKFYKKENWAELYLRLMRRSLQYDLMTSALLCRNSLKDIAFKFDEDDVKRSLQNIREYTESLFSNVREIKYSELALLHSPTNITAQKVFPITFKSKQRVLFPFFDENLMKFSFQNMETFSQEIAKQVLKAPLAQLVGDDLVYRPKSGFVPPMNEILRDQSMISILETEIDQMNHQISEHLDLSFIDELVSVLKTKEHLPYQTINYIWSLVFLKLWTS